MSGMSNYLRNALVDWHRGQTFIAAPTTYFALLTSIKGARSTLNSTNVAQNDTFSVVCSDSKVHLYKVTSAGGAQALAGSQPGTYTGTVAESITDGAATVQEQTNALNANTAQVEPVGNAYARKKSAAGGGPNQLTDWRSTQGDNLASTGTTGTTSNTADQSFGTPTGSGWGKVWGWALYDALTVGNLIFWGSLSTARVIPAGNQVLFSAGQLSIVLSPG